MDLSEFRVRFEVRQSDSDTPNNASIRVYNLRPETIQTIAQQFTKIILEAGYVNGNKGVIFTGDVKQYRHGKENNTDRYLDIFAADGDSLWVSSTMKTNVPANTPIATYEKTLSDQAGAAIQSADATNKTLAPFGGVVPRGRVLHGMARDYLAAYSRTQNCRWFISNGNIVFVSNSSYLASQTIITLNGDTGLVGYPEATNEGIAFRCLLNPNIKLGGRVNLDNKAIITTDQLAQGYPNYSSVDFPALLAADGIYRVLVVDFEGDTRGNAWYCNCIALAIQTDRPMQFAVQTGGAS